MVVLYWLDAGPDAQLSRLRKKSVAELEAKIDELRTLAPTAATSATRSPNRGEVSAGAGRLYANLTPWQKTLVARHPQRPHFTDFINALITEFTPFAGDPEFGEDETLVGGFRPLQNETDLRDGPGKTTRPKAASSTISAWPVPKAIARPVRLMDGRALRHSRCCRSWIPPAPIPASAPKSADRPKRSRARPIRVFRSVSQRRDRHRRRHVGRAIAITTPTKVLMFEHAIWRDLAGSRLVDSLARRHQGTGKPPTA